MTLENRISLPAAVPVTTLHVTPVTHLKYPGVFNIVNLDKNRAICAHITRVIYNNPATVVFWSDGTKTVSRCAEGDVYNAETGLALCLLKKFLGGAKVHDVMTAWLPDENSMEHFDINISGVRHRAKAQTK